ncbi:MAG: hypothetical protein MRJ92_12125 [Nitrospira sp.]|nr:hypothetical protein [Nitrospira sp.]
MTRLLVFDVLLLAAAGLVRERIVLSGDLREVVPRGAWDLDVELSAG